MTNGMAAALAPQEQAMAVDLAAPRQQSEAVAAVEAQVFLAKTYPRNEEAAYQKILKVCERPSFALEATYEFPRGGSKIIGGSVALAREMKRLWGNIDSGNRIVRDDGENIYCEAFAWDCEVNTRIRREVQVSKYLWKKGKYKQPGRHVLVGAQRGEDDKDLERDFREKVQNIAARAERECIRQLLPNDYWAEAIAACQETVRNKIDTDPDAAKKLLMRGMSRVNVSVEMIEEHIGCKIAQASPAQVGTLREIYQQIHGGDATWRDLTESDKKSGPIQGSIDPSDLKPSDEPNRGHANVAPAKPAAASLTIDSFAEGGERADDQKQD